MEEAWEQQWQSLSCGMEEKAVRLALIPLRSTLPNRVNQLEAAALDGELIDMLMDQVWCCP